MTLGIHRLVVARHHGSQDEVAVKDYTVQGTRNYEQMTVVEAAMVTSAASTFFPPVEVDGQKYVDGALGSNNPVEIVWSEAQDIWAKEGNFREHLQCVVSVGTGVPKFTGISDSAKKFFTETLVDIVTQTGETARRFEKGNRDLLTRHGARRYFR